MVIGTLSRISSPTGIEYEYEVPRSPWKKPVTHEAYRSRTGRSSPISFCRASIRSGVASVPSCDFAASPGMTEKAKNDKKDTRSSVRRREPNFFAMYFMNGNSSLCNVGYSGNFSRLIKAGTEKLRAYRLKVFVHVIFIVDNAGVNSKIKLEYLELQNNRKRPLA